MANKSLKTKTAKKKKKSVKKRKAKTSLGSLKSNIDSLEALKTQVPEDKYVQALEHKQILNSEQEELKKTADQPVTPLVKKEYSKVHLWAIVLSIFVIIFIIWIFTWRLNIKIENANGQSFTNIANDFFSSFENLENNLSNLNSNISKLENATNQNINNNVNAIISNPQNLNTEEINQMEEQVIPKLK